MIKIYVFKILINFMSFVCISYNIPRGLMTYVPFNTENDQFFQIYLEITL